jgi:NAD(P)H-hydrate epimerase
MKSLEILSADEMKRVDAASVDAGIPIAELMEHAGEAVAAFCLRHYPNAAHVLVLAGKGNNGGDGLVAARALAGEGVGVRVLLAGRQADVKGAAEQALLRLKEATDDGIVEELSDEVAGDALALQELFSEADLIVDAIVGTGFKPPLHGMAMQLRDALAAMQIPVVAVDLPSGWDADSQQEKAPDAFRADAVVTFTAPKFAHVFGHLTERVFGPVVVAELGSPESAVRSGAKLHWSGSSKRRTEQPRPVNSNKGKFGHVLVVGGSFGTAGAPSMASLACLRSGAGLVTAAVPRSIVNLVGGVTPELMVRPLAEDDNGVASTAALLNLNALTQGIKVIALGPGLSMRGEASFFARSLVERTTLPIIIDADGLNAFDADHVGSLDGRDRPMVLTPHPGEFARLLGRTVPEVEADRIQLARSFAIEHHLTLVLKGWRTLIAHADGSVAVNTNGNPGLAKGGSGDILTGIVAAMLAQYPSNVAQAVEAAVFLHGLAADLAVQHRNEKTLLATDVIDALSDAFDYRTQDEDGLEWLCGVRSMKREQG